MLWRQRSAHEASRYERNQIRQQDPPSPERGRAPGWKFRRPHRRAAARGARARARGAPHLYRQRARAGFRLGAQWQPIDPISVGFGGFSLRVLLPTLLLSAGLISIYSWQQEQRAADALELDAQLLTDDLPIDAYLDRGFEAWLKKVSSSNADDNN
jgi:hypothetical protein